MFTLLKQATLKKGEYKKEITRLYAQLNTAVFYKELYDSLDEKWLKIYTTHPISEAKIMQLYNISEEMLCEDKAKYGRQNVYLIDIKSETEIKPETEIKSTTEIKSETEVKSATEIKSEPGTDVKSG
jgi:hypothetical protein